MLNASQYFIDQSIFEGEYVFESPTGKFKLESTGKVKMNGKTSNGYKVYKLVDHTWIYQNTIYTKKARRRGRTLEEIYYEDIN